MHLRRIVFKFTGPLERNLFSREEGGWHTGTVQCVGGCKSNRGVGRERERRDKKRVEGEMSEREDKEKKEAGSHEDELLPSDEGEAAFLSTSGRR